MVWPSGGRSLNRVHTRSLISEENQLITQRLHYKGAYKERTIKHAISHRSMMNLTPILAVLTSAIWPVAAVSPTKQPTTKGSPTKPSSAAKGACSAGYYRKSPSSPCLKACFANDTVTLFGISFPCNAKQIQLIGSGLTGTIPQEIAALTALTLLDLSNSEYASSFALNLLTGPLPTELFMLT